MSKPITVLVSIDSNSLLLGARHLKNYLKTLVENYNLSSMVEILETGSFGEYGRGVLFLVLPDDVMYSAKSEVDIEKIVLEHLLKGRKVRDLVVADFDSGGSFEATKSTSEVRIVLRNAGSIDPRNLEEYIALDGYQGLAKALRMTPEEVIEELKKSNLRGRGGAGFPTGLKWEFTQKVRSDEKFVICNADEGEPGTFKDRLIMEGDPHSVIEGMVIAGYAVGASKGYIYIRGEYFESVSSLRDAINKAYEYGLLGQSVLGTEFSFDLSVRLGAGAYVCGEETALIESIEGKSGRPRLKPPYPPVSGLYDKPTVVNNVETFACVPPIIDKGAGWFRSIGTQSSPGTKVFSLCGDLVKRGIVEVPMGTSVRDLVHKFGGGISKGRTLKMVQTGGAAGTFIKPEEMDAELDFDSFKKSGASLGSGVILAIDETHCAVDIAKNLMEFFAHESCGKCSPCREGTRVIVHILNEFSKGRGTVEMFNQLYDISETMEESSFCGLGQSVPIPLRSILDRFKDEFLSHLNSPGCPVGVCEFDKPEKKKR
ncbi:MULTISPECIES: NADH-quinone oxidoreductase subunit NuoF [Mesotoga]|uniref:NADH-quinone oxidoreductase subunit NuoF n=1 Tax=Mesotoga TaxID=1184396 RepID=UPI00039CBFA0|nr:MULTISPECIES: NADH-quinone oxidoreductase subunit NuoF [Mesotoga]MCP5456461.1 NADH-quinone oxidoreductase subunit NuoF [Thermotogota bacterium]MCB1222511.1 NADH-quinone oxidoreductase subunit NuoF [Mesotoga sp.]MCP5460422.1 NADH-quinone oxidoreductase subunit NuoF [Thermotogota bacterium]MDK2943410.1 NADP-reducing hydrogenase subunit HndC [Mesotoga sp.]HNQ70282.1 NADH-quinone oxidoreductase subunit NuoF [Mesotoga prima]